MCVFVCACTRAQWCEWATSDDLSCCCYWMFFLLFFVADFGVLVAVLSDVPSHNRLHPEENIQLIKPKNFAMYFKFNKGIFFPVPSMIKQHISLLKSRFVFVIVILFFIFNQIFWHCVKYTLQCKLFGLILWFRCMPSQFTSAFAFIPLSDAFIQSDSLVRQNTIQTRSWATFTIFRQSSKTCLLLWFCIGIKSQIFAASQMFLLNSCSFLRVISYLTIIPTDHTRQYGLTNKEGTQNLCGT